MALDMSQFEDRFAAGFSRIVTRRRFLQRGLTAAAATAAATSATLVRPSSARAAPSCQFTSGNWGCSCAGTQSCGTGKCCRTLYDTTKDACCGGATRRCNYWGSFPYCWCSQRCCIGGNYGYYSCCDCWKYGSSGCRSGNTACICKGRKVLRSC